MPTTAGPYTILMHKRVMSVKDDPVVVDLENHGIARISFIENADLKRQIEIKSSPGEMKIEATNWNNTLGTAVSKPLNHGKNAKLNFYILLSSTIVGAIRHLDIQIMTAPLDATETNEKA